MDCKYNINGICRRTSATASGKECAFDSVANCEVLKRQFMANQMFLTVFDQYITEGELLEIIPSKNDIATYSRYYRLDFHCANGRFPTVTIVNDQKEFLDNVHEKYFANKGAK